MNASFCALFAVPNAGALLVIISVSSLLLKSVRVEWLFLMRTVAPLVASVSVVAFYPVVISVHLVRVEDTVPRA